MVGHVRTLSEIEEAVLKLPPEEFSELLRRMQERLDQESSGELRAELAVVLYVRGALSMGKAAEMARLSRWAFEELLAKRNVTRNYSEDDLRHDLEWRRPADGGLAS